jgi:hypothetical protein
MRFDQTGEVLHYVERFHEELGRNYAELRERITDERSRMMLDYMRARESDMAEAIASFAHGSVDPTLKEWDPFTIDDTAIKVRLKNGLRPDATTDELLGLALEVAAWLEGLFLGLEAKSGTPDQKALFASLRDRAEHEKHKLVRNANMLLDF